MSLHAAEPSGSLAHFVDVFMDQITSPRYSKCTQGVTLDKQVKRVKYR